jgi:hypothetical protein
MAVCWSQVRATKRTGISVGPTCLRSTACRPSRSFSAVASPFCCPQYTQRPLLQAISRNILGQGRALSNGPSARSNLLRHQSLHFHSTARSFPTLDRPVDSPSPSSNQPANQRARDTLNLFTQSPSSEPFVTQPVQFFGAPSWRRSRGKVREYKVSGSSLLRLNSQISFASEFKVNVPSEVSLLHDFNNKGIYSYSSLTNNTSKPHFYPDSPLTMPAANTVNQTNREPGGIM